VEAEQEIGLRFWNGFGAVLLRQWHHAANAKLLERCDPAIIYS